MRILLLFFFSILHAIDCSCPKGFDLESEGQCRGWYAKINTHYDQGAEAAVAKCKEINGLPIIIHSEEDQLYWCNRATTATEPIIGLLCNTTSMLWEWADGSAVDYVPNPYDSWNKKCSTGCSVRVPITEYSDVWWIGCIPDPLTSDIFCTTQLSQPVPSPDGYGCDIYENDSEDGVCYQIAAAAENWQDAQLICRNIGGNLASIHNLQENSFVRRLAVSKGAVNGIFLGATVSGKGNEFGWIDGSEWDYANFQPGFPMSGTGDCLAMDTSSSSGPWLNIDCSAKFPVVCIRERLPVSEPICTGGPWGENTIITSPGFPYTSSTPCDFFLSVEAGNRVEMEIVILEANKCCDSLIIYDGFLGGNVIANLTGEKHYATYTSTSNTMRVSWQPNGGVNVRGMAITYRGV